MGQAQDRWRHALARSGLRILLGQLLGVQAASLVIQPDEQGKPQLVDGGARCMAPQFNLSHGGDLVLLALHPSQAVGVDGERLDRRCHPERLASRLLSASQQRELASLPAHKRREALLRQWCRLEAQLKCTGQGLAGLETLRQAQGGLNPALQVLDLALPAGYCGALAWTRPIKEKPA
jgi:4'-phosphopantetheinyl transferase